MKAQQAGKDTRIGIPLIHWKKNLARNHLFLTSLECPWGTEWWAQLENLARNVTTDNF